eukprot:g45713.t1
MVGQPQGYSYDEYALTRGKCIVLEVKKGMSHKMRLLTADTLDIILVPAGDKRENLTTKRHHQLGQHLLPIPNCPEGSLSVNHIAVGLESHVGQT